MNRTIQIFQKFRRQRGSFWIARKGIDDLLRCEERFGHMTEKDINLPILSIVEIGGIAQDHFPNQPHIMTSINKTNSLVVVLLVGFLGLPLKGIPLWDVNFDDPTVFPAGQPPATASATAGEVNDRPTSVFATAGGDSSILVQNSFQGPTGDIMTGRPVVFDYHNGESFRLSFNGNAADFEAPANYHLSFDFLIASDIGSNHGTFRLDMAHAATTGGLITILWVPTSTDQRFTVIPAGQASSEWVTINNAWEFDKVSRFDGVLNASTGFFHISIDGTELDAIDLGQYLDSSELGVRNFSFAQGSTGSEGWSGAIDNIVGIPEPGSGSLLGVGVLLLYLLKRQR